MGKKIVLLEFADEAKSFLDYCEKEGLAPADFLIIALEPQVQIFLKREGIAYENTLPFFTNESHARVLLKSEEWVGFLSDRLELEDGEGVDETYNDTFLFFSRFYMHHVLKYAEMVSEIFRKTDVDAVYACVFSNAFVPHDPPHIKNNERFVGLIAKKYAATKNVPFVEIPAPLHEVGANTQKSGPPPSSSFEKRVLDTYKSLWTRFLKRKKVVLLISTGYNIGRLSLGLRKKFPESKWVEISNRSPARCLSEFLAEKPIHLMKKGVGYLLDARIPIDRYGSQDSADDSPLARRIDGLNGRLRDEWSAFFTCNGISFVELMLGKIERDLKPFLLKLYLESKSIREILGRLDVKLLIAPFARERSLLIGEMCHKKGIPTLMISHGTLKAPENDLERIEYQHMGTSLTLSKFYRYTVLQSPVMEAHFNSYETSNVPVRTGNLILSKIGNKDKNTIKKRILGDIDPNKKILLYPENVRQRYNERFQVFETFDEFLSTSADLVNAVNEIGNMHLVIRLHPGRNISPEDMKALLPKSDNLTIDTSGGPFSEVLPIADLLVNYSSTVIEEALNNSIPVLLYDKRGRYRHLDAARLSGGEKELSSAYYINDSGLLKEGLKWILDNQLTASGVPKSIFNKYTFSEDNYSNFEELVSNALNGGLKQ